MLHSVIQLESHRLCTLFRSKNFNAACCACFFYLCGAEKDRFVLPWKATTEFGYFHDLTNVWVFLFQVAVSTPASTAAGQPRELFPRSRGDQES